MKRLFAFLLACVCALALFGCAGANDDKSDGGPEDDTTPLTETQIEEFKELFASAADVTDETTGEYRYTTSTPVSCFFTSHYDDPRDIDLAEFCGTVRSAPRWGTRTWRNSTLYSTRWE